MAQDSKLKVAELDFDRIKSNLKEFMKSQSEFSDYNFDGSGLSVLLDILAYNTHYMGYYMNMVANEMFMDTALLRSSVVSHAKLLGYTPRSRAAAQATINLALDIVVGDANNSVTLPRFSRFISGNKDGKNYVFVNTNQTTATKNSAGGFYFENLIIKEGQPQSYAFGFDATNNTKQIFELPDVGIDTSTLRVQVQTSAQNTSKETFILAQDSTAVSANSSVYYLEENRNGKYQIYFGDGIVGKALTDGNIVIVTYIVSTGTDANGIKTFKLVDNLTGYGSSVSLVSESASGNLEETIDEIRKVAPKSFISQNRAVTKNDYITLINRDYPYFSAVTVWGGEENDPPIYGKVFFSAKPTANYEVSQTEIDYLANKVIRPLSIMTVKPEYVAPDYTFINMEVNVSFDSTRTNKTEGQIETSVRSAILNYAAANLNSFDNTLKTSKLMREIDIADTSIENNEVIIQLEKRFRPVVNKTKDYTIDFGVALSPGNSVKRLFASPSFGHYDNSGVLRNAYLEEIPQSFTGIQTINIVNPGSGYTELPTVTLLGDGQGAELEAVLVNGRVKSINILKPGIDYTSAAITISGGGGSGAEAAPILEAKRGTIRMYYFDDNKVKKIINEEAGTIHYDTGIVVLNDFSPVSVEDAYGTVVVKAYPKNTVFSVSKNKILALDSTDPESLKINVLAVET
jgi:hypothetical protein